MNIKNGVVNSINGAVKELSNMMEKYVDEGVCFKSQITPVSGKFGEYRSYVRITWNDGVKFKGSDSIIFDLHSFNVDDLIILYYELMKYKNYVINRIRMIDSIVNNIDISKNIESEDIFNGRIMYYMSD